MIYFQQGHGGARMIEVNAEDPFAWIKDSTQTITGSISDYKRFQSINFISGEMKTEDGFAHRKNENVLSRDLLVLDSDEKGIDHMEVAERCAIAGYEALIYPTPNYTDEHQRFRVVLRLPFSSRKPDNYATTVSCSAEFLGIPHDPCSATWSQMQGGPIRKPGIPEIIHLDGDPFPVKVAPRAPERPKTSWRDGRSSYLASGGRLGPADALEVMSRYEARDRHALQERSVYLSALFHIIRAVQIGEIDQRTGEQCAVILAGNNPEWQSNNAKHFNNELNKSNPRATKGFLEKFHYGKQGD